MLNRNGQQRLKIGNMGVPLMEEPTTGVTLAGQRREGNALDIAQWKGPRIFIHMLQFHWHQAMSISCNEEALGCLVALEELVHYLKTHTETMEEFLVNGVDIDAAERAIVAMQLSDVQGQFWSTVVALHQRIDQVERQVQGKVLAI